jgi:hypothetical protein
MSANSYKLGRALGATSTATKVTVVVLAAVAIWFVIYSRDQERQRAAAASAAQTQAAKAKAEEAERQREQAAQQQLADQKVRCAKGQELVIGAALAEMRKGNPDAAVSMLVPCEGLADLSAHRDALARARVAAEAASKKRLAQVEADARAQRRREGVSIGMTQADALASSWGRPEKVNRTTTVRGEREQWVYPGGYLYFENGILTAIQN